MDQRHLNFSAGPAALPLPVLLEAQRNLVVLPGVGASPLEVSHRGGWFEDVIGEAERNLRGLLAIPDSHAVVFCQGGATQQFSMVAMNLLRGSGRAADYLVTGSWGAKAVAEARKEGEVNVAWSGAGEGFVSVPEPTAWAGRLTRESAYVHLTSNETIQGVQWPDPSSPAGAGTLVADMSSDILSRPLDVSRFGLIYAGAQKNVGPAGVTVVIVDRAVLERIPDGLPVVLDYRTFVQERSLYNTPPVFSIYVLLLVTRWLRDVVGGVEKQFEINRKKAGLIYGAIDASSGFYRGHASAASRSQMNVTWRLPSGDLEDAFVAEAAVEGMVGLKGHRSVGGIRASLYNAVTPEAARALASFMRNFAAAHA